MIKGALDYKFECLLSDPLDMTGKSALFLVVVSSSVTKGLFCFVFSDNLLGLFKL